MAGTNTCTISGAGSASFAGLVAADVAGGWGKFTADATGTQIICAGKIVVGDGTNACVFSDTKKQVFFTTLNAVPIVLVKSAATLTLGTLIDANLKTTKDGCSLFCSETSLYKRFINSEVNSTVNFYSSQFTQTNPSYPDRCSIVSTFLVYNCIFTSIVLLSPGATSDLYNVLFHGSDQSIGYGSYGTMDRITIYNMSTCAFQSQSGAHFTVYNSVVYGCTYLAQILSTGNNYIINGVADTWNFQFTAAGAVFRQYEFSCYILDASGSPIEDATVTLIDNASTEIFSEDTDGSGFITVQTVTRGYYDQAHGDTLQDAGPHTLTVTKAGYIPYTCTFVLEKEITEFPITLHAQLSGTAEAADVLAGETFYSTDADTQQTGTRSSIQEIEPAVILEKEKIVYLKDPLREPLLMATYALVADDLKLRRKLRNVHIKY